MMRDIVEIYHRFALEAVKLRSEPLTGTVLGAQEAVSIQYRHLHQRYLRVTVLQGSIVAS